MPKGLAQRLSQSRKGRGGLGKGSGTSLGLIARLEGAFDALLVVLQQAESDDLVRSAILAEEAYALRQRISSVAAAAKRGAGNGSSSSARSGSKRGDHVPPSGSSSADSDEGGGASPRAPSSSSSSVSSPLPALVESPLAPLDAMPSGAVKGIRKGLQRLSLRLFGLFVERNEANIKQVLRKGLVPRVLGMLRRELPPHPHLDGVVDAAERMLDSGRAGPRTAE